MEVRRRVVVIKAGRTKPLDQYFLYNSGNSYTLIDLSGVLPTGVVELIDGYDAIIVIGSLSQFPQHEEVLRKYSMEAQKSVEFWTY